MVHIYYHVYAIDGVESIIDEQLNLIKIHFDFPYTLNVGISVASKNQSIKYILEKFNNVRNIQTEGNEWTTLDLIEKDKEKFGDSDYILYIHTKGASKIYSTNKKLWRHLMNYYNIEKVKDVFKLFKETEYNTCGILFGDFKDWRCYSGNFWWMKADYVKSINTCGVKKHNRFTAEYSFIQLGIDWKPYSLYNYKENKFFEMLFERNSVNKTKLKIKKDLI